MLDEIINLLPPLFIIVLVSFSYYTFVVEFVVFIVHGNIKKVLYLCVFHIVLVMFIWSFVQTMARTHRQIPEEYRLNSSDHARLLTYTEEEADRILVKIIHVRGLEIATCTSNGRIRYCKTCQWIKPDRTHHCSSCNQCVMKMDHHCPWVFNCVGFANYKQFILTLFYGTLLCVFYGGAAIEYQRYIWRHLYRDNGACLLVLVGWFVTLLSGIFVGILLVYHLSLVWRNETTLEALREITFKEGNAAFDLGAWRNFEEVFGSNVCCWLVPIFTSKGNGHEFQLGNLIT